jgi:hypothetical protein
MNLFYKNILIFCFQIKLISNHFDIFHYNYSKLILNEHRYIIKIKYHDLFQDLIANEPKI